MKRGCGFPRQREHWLGMTPLRGVRGDVGIAPYENTWGAFVQRAAG